VDQPQDSEIIIDPPSKSPFGLIGQKISGAFDIGDQPQTDSEATRPGTEADEAIARSGKRIEQTLDYVGRKVHSLVEVPPPETSLSTEATRPGTEVNTAVARVGKHIEEYLHAATSSGKADAWQATSAALKDAGSSMEKIPSEIKQKASELTDKASTIAHDTAAQVSSQLPSEKQNLRSRGQEQAEFDRRFQEARQYQANHTSTSAHWPNTKPSPRQPMVPPNQPTPVPISEPALPKREEEEGGFFSSITSWFTGK